MAPTCATASVRIVGGRTGASPGRCAEIALVERHVLDADDPLVRLELGDAIDEQERIPMRKDPLDGRIVEGEREVHRVSVWRAAICQERQARAWLQCAV